MDMWRKLVVDSLVRPREAAGRVLALALPREVLIQAAVAVTATGIVFGFLAMQLSADGIDSISAAILGNPLVGALIQFSVILLAGVLTWRIGRAFGGTGGLDGALALVIWLNAMMVVIQLVQLAVLVVLPPFAGLIAIATAFWALWAFANFVTELHSFQNPVFVLGGVILTLIVLFFGLAMLLAILGFGPQEPI